MTQTIPTTSPAGPTVRATYTESYVVEIATQHPDRKELHETIEVPEGTYAAARVRAGLVATLRGLPLAAGEPLLYEVDEPANFYAELVSRPWDRPTQNGIPSYTLIVTVATCYSVVLERTITDLPCSGEPAAEHAADAELARQGWQRAAGWLGRPLDLERILGSRHLGATSVAPLRKTMSVERPSVGACLDEMNY